MLKFSGRDRVMDSDRIIVSKTDLTGKISYASSYFLEISDYQFQDLIGKPHSVVRQPNVPRCIFKMLWELLKDGREAFAYLVNNTKNGDHYWVFAHVTPSRNEQGEITGYHSNRRKPQAKALVEIAALYERLLAVEGNAANRKVGLQQSYEMLVDILAKKGQDYDEYVLSL